MRRREFLEAGALTAIGSLVTRTLGAQTAETLGVHTASPQNLATPLRYFDREITPTRAFFVRSHFGPPRLDRGRRLLIDGSVRTPLDLDLAALTAMPQTTVTAVLQCAGNGRALHAPRVAGIQWAHGGMSQATWTGVPLRDLLARAGVRRGAAHVELRTADLSPKPTVPAFLRSIPLDRAMEETTMVAHSMNGAPLGLLHGAPFRLVVPGWSGNHWLKWLVGIHVQENEAQGFYMQTGYRMPRAPVEPGAAVPPEQTVPATTFPVKSVIASPAGGERRPAGPQQVVGVAFSGEAPIAKVEVSVDGGRTWAEASLEGERSLGRWVVFRHRFDAAAGPVRALARASDARGGVQPERAAWNPSGYFWNAWHAVEWVVG